MSAESVKAKKVSNEEELMDLFAQYIAQEIINRKKQKREGENSVRRNKEDDEG